MFLSAVAMFPAWFMEWLHVLLGGGWERELPAGLTLTFLLGWMILLFLAVRYLLAIMPLRMALTPKRTKARRVRRRALVYFQVGAERRTMGRTGIRSEAHTSELQALMRISYAVFCLTKKTKSNKRHNINHIHD